MALNQILKENNLTKYRLAKSSGVPYTTINDICSDKTDIKKCSAETVYKISKVLGISIESLILPYMEERIDFDLFKSNTCHRLKELGDIDFIIKLLEEEKIKYYYDKKWYPESFYLLAMLDFLSKENDIPICNEYDRLRNQKLKKTLFPSSILMASEVAGNKELLQKSLKEAIPEFLKYNIVESEIRNVI